MTENTVLNYSVKTVTTPLLLTIATITTITLTIMIDINIHKVCQTPLKHDRMDIEAHLKTAHKITCRVYEINFESGQVTIVFFPEN